MASPTRHRPKPRSALAIVVVAGALLLAGCGASNDPATWEEAEAQDGFPVRTNFLDACEEANAGQEGMSDEEAEAFCECSFAEVRESMSFDEFEELDDQLRADPEDLPSDVRALFEGCAVEFA